VLYDRGRDFEVRNPQVDGVVVGSCQRCGLYWPAPGLDDTRLS
jgi:hypothetical protein